MTTKRSLDVSPAPPCEFCQIIRGGAPARTVLETRDVVAFFPLDPAAVGHVLVVPRIHVETIWQLDTDTAHVLADAVIRVAHAMRTALKPDGLNIIQSNGAAATQTIDHLHTHVVPRWAGDRIGDFWPLDQPWSRSDLDRARDAIADQL